MTIILQQKPIFKDKLPDETLPCPFCCEERVSLHQESTRAFCIFCPICEGSGPYKETREDAWKAWQERKYHPKHHSELEKIAVRLGKMNRPEHSKPFKWESFYDTDPPYWRVADTILIILDDYDAKVKDVYRRVANLFAKIRALIEEDFDEDLESWEGPEDETLNRR